MKKFVAGFVLGVAAATAGWFGVLVVADAVLQEEDGWGG